MLSEKSRSDFDHTKKAEYFDAEGYMVADEQNKNKLKNPQHVDKLQTEEQD